MKPLSIQSEAERTLERLIQERKSADPSKWSDDARRAFAEYVRGNPPPNSLLLMVRILGPDTAGPVLAHEWKTVSGNLRAAFIEGCRSRKNALPAVALLAESFQTAGEDAVARDLLGIIVSRLGRLDQPDAHKDAEHFGQVGGLRRSARTIRLAIAEPEAVDRSLKTLVEAAERLFATGGKKAEKHLVELLQVLTEALDDERPGLEKTHPLVLSVERMVVNASTPKEQRHSRAVSTPRGSVNRTLTVVEEARAMEVRPPTAETTVSTPIEPTPISSQKGEPPARSTSREAQVRNLPTQEKPTRSETAGHGAFPVGELTAWIESVAARLQKNPELDALQVGIFKLEARLSALESAAERDREAVEIRFRSARQEAQEALVQYNKAVTLQVKVTEELAERTIALREQGRAAFAERDNALALGRKLQQELEREKALLEEEQKELDRTVKELPRQRVQEFKKRLEGKLLPILSELEEPAEGVSPEHHLEVLVDRLRALREVLVSEGVLNG